jgi:hypothetical protein
MRADISEMNIGMDDCIVYQKKCPYINKSFINKCLYLRYCFSINVAQEKNNTAQIIKGFRYNLSKIILTIEHN